MENYRLNGLYRDQNDISILNDKGKINWKETITNVTPVLWKRSIIYPEFYVYTSDNVDSIITEIQKYCINYIYQIFWWIYGEKRTILFPKVNMSMKIDYMIFELNKKMY